MIKTVVDENKEGFSIEIEGRADRLVGECAGAASEIIAAAYKEDGLEEALFTFASIVAHTLQYVEQDLGIDLMEEMRNVNKQMRRDPFTMGMSGDAFAKFMNDINLGGE